jgi:hypothetical protein
MTASLIVVALGAVIAAVGTGVLAARCARTPKIFLVAWTLAIFGLAVSLAAQALGDLAGYSDATFRAMELGAQAIAPLALSLGLVELIAWSLPGRFAMRLAVSAIGVIVLVILGTDPLSVREAQRSWPDHPLSASSSPIHRLSYLHGRHRGDQRAGRARKVQPRPCLRRSDEASSDRQRSGGCDLCAWRDDDRAREVRQQCFRARSCARRGADLARCQLCQPPGTGRPARGP